MEITSNIESMHFLIDLGGNKIGVGSIRCLVKAILSLVTYIHLGKADLIEMATI
jgi:hypothetical protein